MYTMILIKCITLHTNYIIDNNSITVKAISFHFRGGERPSTTTTNTTPFSEKIRNV